jgi:hypothetical protein
VKSSILPEPWPQYGIGDGGNGLSQPTPEDAYHQSNYEVQKPSPGRLKALALLLPRPIA